MEAISTGITNLMGIVETMLTSITSNSLLVVIFSAGFISLGLGVLRKLIRTSKSVG